MWQKERSKRSPPQGLSTLYPSFHRPPKRPLEFYPKTLAQAPGAGLAATPAGRCNLAHDLEEIGRETNQQAFNDCFHILAVVLFAAILVALLCRPAKGPAAAGAH